ncbi:MAG TPA: glycosyltransferase [Phototrophicaceae bacterium]|nr:glycosyltransferase [Phototrophicaceae bacterium]
MHVLIVPSYYPSPKAPITGIFIQKQAQALHKAGHRVGVLVTPRVNVTLEQARRAGLTSLRTTTRETYFTEFPVYRMHWGWFPRVAPPLVTLLLRTAGKRAFDLYCREQGRPDVLHAHNIFYGAYLAAYLGKRYDIPVVLTEHSSSYLEGLVIFPGQAQIVAQTLRSIDARLVVGSSLIGALHKYAPEVPIDVLGNVIDTHFFTPDDRVLPSTPFTFTVIAQLKERRKGFEVLIEGFQRAFAGRQDVILNIRGDGPLKPEIEAQIARLGIGSQVKFLGYMSMEQLRELIRSSHAVVSSSHVETFAVSVAEAMACGKPVVVTRSGGPEDYVTDESGIIVPPGDPAALAAAMQQLYSNYARYKPETVRAVCVEQFSEEALVSRLQTVYSAVSAHIEPGL